MVHKDVEFHVKASGRDTRTHTTFPEAAADAVSLSVAGLTDVVIDVIIWSEEGARAFGGDDAVERYQEDPDASVFERVTVNADSKGRIS